MAIKTKNKTWVDNENVTYTDLNANFDGIYNEFNGSISNTNVAAGAGIAESKLAFSTSTGHDHDGINSKAIAKGFVWTISGTQVTKEDAGPYLYVNTAQTVTKAILILKVAPTGASFICDVEKSSDNGANWTSLWNTNTANRPTIAAGDKVGTTTSFDISSLSAGDILRPAIDQVGSTVAGSGLTIQLTT